MDEVLEVVDGISDFYGGSRPEGVFVIKSEKDKEFSVKIDRHFSLVCIC